MTAQAFTRSILLGDSQFSVSIGGAAWPIPNVMVALWAAQGLYFKPEFDLYSQSGRLHFLRHFINNYSGLVKEFPALGTLLGRDVIARLLTQSVIPQSEQTDFYLPAFLFFVYLSRPDLIQLFPISRLEGLLSYLFWIQQCGYDTLPASQLFDVFKECVPQTLFVAKNRIFDVFAAVDVPLIFDEEKYLKDYPDVKRDIEANYIISGQQHWKVHGNQEGRSAIWAFDWQRIEEQPLIYQGQIWDLPAQRQNLEQALQILLRQSPTFVDENTPM